MHRVSSALSDMREAQSNRSMSSTTSNAFTVSVSALLGGLAGGVACCSLSLIFPWPGVFWIVPIGGVLGAFSRWQGYRGRAAAACAVLAILIAFAYAQFLCGAIRIADALSISLRETLFKAGFDFIADVAWANLRWTGWSAFAFAIAVGTSIAVLPFRGRRAVADPAQPLH
jgi:hypothetical protein